MASAEVSWHTRDKCQSQTLPRTPVYKLFSSLIKEIDAIGFKYIIYIKYMQP